jgi:hypothetical protein
MYALTTLPQLRATAMHKYIRTLLNIIFAALTRK